MYGLLPPLQSNFNITPKCSGFFEIDLVMCHFNEIIPPHPRLFVKYLAVWELRNHVRTVIPIPFENSSNNSRKFSKFVKLYIIVYTLILIISIFSQ